jgi:hypothetical protein
VNRDVSLVRELDCIAQEIQHHLAQSTGVGITGATIALTTALTGGTMNVLGNYTGDVAPNVPVDTTGNVLPFYLLVAGSGNDAAYTDAQVMAAATLQRMSLNKSFNGFRPPKPFSRA